MLLDERALVREFHRIMEVPIRDSTPAGVSLTEIALRSRLIREECVELITALKNNVDEEILDGGVDTIYVVEGTRVQFGRPEGGESDPVAANLLLANALNYLDSALNSRSWGEVDVALRMVEIVVKGVMTVRDLPYEIAFETVHENNLTKVGPDGVVLKDEGGKVLKPAGYEKVNLSVILEAQRQIMGDLLRLHERAKLLLKERTRGEC